MELAGKTLTEEQIKRVLLTIMQQANQDTYEDIDNTPEDCNDGVFIYDESLPYNSNDEATYFARDLLSELGLCAADGRRLEHSVIKQNSSEVEGVV